MKRTRKSYVLVMGVFLICGWVMPMQAANVAPQTNVFAERPLIHILGPSPAISPSLDRSAVDSSVLESCAVLKDTDGTWYWYYHAQSKDKERWPHGYRVCVATAPGPLGPWTKYEKNPVLDLREGEMDAWMTACVVVLKEGAYDIRERNAKYYMWYISRWAGFGDRGQSSGPLGTKERQPADG